MNAWQEYLAAAQALDAERRAAAVGAAEQAAMLNAADEELAAIRGRLALQRTRFAHAASQAGIHVPPLDPTEAEVRAVAMPGGGPGVLVALRHARSMVDNADAELLAVESGQRGALAAGPPALRNLVVYLPFAALALVLQVTLFIVASAESLPLLAPLCGLVLPGLAFALGWLTIGLVYPPAAAGDKVQRTPLVGALVCLVAPALITCAGIGITALMR